jgi:hypothetical protein
MSALSSSVTKGEQPDGVRVPDWTLEQLEYIRRHILDPGFFAFRSLDDPKVIRVLQSANEQLGATRRDSRGKRQQQRTGK